MLKLFITLIQCPETGLDENRGLTDTSQRDHWPPISSAGEGSLIAGEYS